MTGDVVWRPPGPGTWEFDASHQSEPFGRFTDALSMDASQRGAARGFREAGLPLETLCSAVINGWWYIKIKPLGGPENAGSPPPAFVFWLLFNLHPELRRRRRAAQRFMSERRWEGVQRNWFERERANYVARIRALQSCAPAALSDGDLCDALERTSRVFEDLAEAHFAAVPASAIPTGDYLVHTEAWTDVSAGQAMRAVAGFTEATTEPLAALDRIAEALRTEDRLGLLEEPDATLAVRRIAEGDTESARLFREYADEFGVRVTTGYSVLCPTLNELPHLMLGNLQRRVALNGTANPAREAAERAARELERRVPREHREAWLGMLHAARRAGEARDDDGGLLMAILGIARGLVLEAGRRLVEVGGADEAESAADLTTSELVQALRGAGPSKADVLKHTAERRLWARLTPPRHLGPDPAPPPIASFPADVRRVVAAMFAFASRFSADADPIAGSGELSGHGVSPGVVRGRARLVVKPEDFQRFRPGDVLVARATTASYNTLLANASAIVTHTGGLIAHAAIVAREFGIPGVVGVQGALDAIPDGSWVEVDGDRGTIEVLGDVPADAPTPSAAAAPEEVALPEPAPGAIARIVGLEHADDGAVFGGKAATLARLLRVGIPIPRGVVLDYVAAWEIAQDDRAVPLDEHISELSGPLAVRSTANVEDSVKASFAGQFVTRLGVTDGAAMKRSVREVLESAHAPGVLAYRQRLGLEEPVRMAVLVQELVDAETAGVMFIDEAKGRIIVEAAYGLGEAVVSGEVTPDRFELDPNGNVLHSELGGKALRLELMGDRLETQRVLPENASEPCVNTAQLAELAALGAQIRDALGGPQDIEWAFAKDGRLFCLQARPISRSL